MDRTQLESQLIEAFDAEPAAARIVARQASDLADSAQYADDFEGPLTVEIVLDNLDDAPAESDLIERWNWWLGALELSHGGYQRFRVRPDVV
ncbi:hypothetical protein HLRTI_002732 [Halorhabdus tiamatea SARL4B]|uniref:Uncharacterized protein n=1 Tax=Halorhabdus tiamatea SARL4B TaxID=1033806 RepID=F7PNL5_9EURY|nr:hypothetical protein [Halorhabdus tiamatea]ERJ05290.1 hypothetical protein HLRTI_002732 [Halorhabdus tiamatea SARL4B]CCQ33749.1 conserved hypothetical protein [Halorhabdus tiamatea SARL4B]